MTLLHPRRTGAQTLLALSLTLSFSLASPLAVAQEASKVQWGKNVEEVAKTMRLPVEPGRGYYDPAALKKENDILTVKVFKFQDPNPKDKGVSYMINCGSQEIASSDNADSPEAKWTPPMHMLAGEPFFSFARKECGWGPGFGSKIKSLFD